MNLLYVTSKGVVATIPYDGTPFAGNGRPCGWVWVERLRYMNGSLQGTALFLAAAVVSGIAGNAAYDVLKVGISKLRLRLQWEGEEEQRPYLSHLAQLAVAAKLNGQVSTKLISCRRLEDHWAAVVVAEDQIYRVQVPLNQPSEVILSRDL